MAEAMYYQVADPSVLGRQYSALGQTFTVTDFDDDDLDDTVTMLRRMKKMMMMMKTMMMTIMVLRRIKNMMMHDDDDDDLVDSNNEDYDDGDEPRLQLQTTFLTLILLMEARLQNKGSG